MGKMIAKAEKYFYLFASQTNWRIVKMIETMESSNIQQGKMTKYWETYTHIHVHSCLFVVLERISFRLTKNNTNKNDTFT